MGTLHSLGQALIENPASEWLRWMLLKIKLEGHHKGFRLDYLADARHSTFEGPGALHKRTRFYHSHLGRHSYVGKESHVGHATIGRFCSIGPWVAIGLGTHPTRGFASMHPLFYSPIGQSGPKGSAWIEPGGPELFKEYLPTTIGHDVWIGARAVLADGVTIGNGALIAAGAVVTKDVEPYTIVGGVPAQPLRKRFDDNDIAMLQAMRWWDWPDAKLRAEAPLMRDINQLRHAHLEGAFADVLARNGGR